MPVANHILQCERTHEHGMHCRMYWLLQNELLHGNLLEYSSTYKKRSAFVTMLMLKVKTSFYSAEMYSAYTYTTMHHKTNFPTMQR